MRLLQVACLLFAVLLAMVCFSAASPAAHYGRGGRARTIRGFKNTALSTARGFGKRDGLAVPTGPFDERDLMAGADSFPVEWFAAEMQNSPELARMIVSKFVDVNQDGELTADELLRPAAF